MTGLQHVSFLTNTILGSAAKTFDRTISILGETEKIADVYFYCITSTQGMHKINRGDKLNLILFLYCCIALTLIDFNLLHIHHFVGGSLIESFTNIY